MKPPHQAWPITAGFQDALFASQLIEQLVSEDSFESFRAPSVDPVTLLSEALDLCDQVIEGRVPPETLKPIIGEIEVALGRDEAILRLASLRVDMLVATIRGSQKIEPYKLKAVLRYLQSAVSGNYQAVAEIVVLELMTNGERTRLRVAIANYIAYLINAGISREHIRTANRKALLDSPPSSGPVVGIASFFSNMNSHRSRHIVYVALGSDFGRYLAGSDIAIVPVQQVSINARQKLAIGLPQHEKVAFGRMIVEAPDAYSAASKALQRLAAARSLSMLAPKVVNCLWGEFLYVESESDGSSQIIDEQASQLKAEPFQTLSKTTIRNLARRSRASLERFDAASRERLLSATNTVALAADSLDSETQIVSLWSAFEILLSQPVSGVRIIHYEGLLVPLICMRHIRRKFISVHDALVNAFRGRYRRIIFSISVPELQDDHTKFMKLILLPEFEGERAAVLEAVKRSPLALNRLGELYHSFSQPTSMLHALDAHESRVRWQIHRLYRTRNNLVHAGRLPPFSRGIASDGYNFFRYAAGNIVRYAEPDDRLREIDQGIAEIGFRYEALKRMLHASRQQNVFTQALLDGVNA